jgi:hypothetical protein
MGAGDFHGRVRDGIGCGLPAMTTRSSSPSTVVGLRSSVVRRKARQTGVGWRFWCCVVRGACLRSLDPGTTEDDFHAWCASLPLVTCFLTTDDWRLTTVS